jgi:hypothetical protein
MSSKCRPRVASRRATTAASLACLLLVACSAGPAPSTPPPSGAGPYPGWPGSGTVVATGDFVPILVSAELGTGHERVLITLQDRAGRTLAAQEVAVDESFYDLAASVDSPVSEVAGTFRWLIPESKAIYTAFTDFARAGDWGVEVTAHEAGQPDRTARITFSVRGTTLSPAIGKPAPASDTPTATDLAAVSAISTDEHPDLAFYALSIRDAVAAGKPFVVVFATPAFCTSGTCGPALDLVKQVAGQYSGRVNFIHVEPYVLEVADGKVQPKLGESGYPQPVPAVTEWGLPTEPYVFVVDARGNVAGKFEGMAYPDELTAALDAILP